MQFKYLPLEFIPLIVQHLVWPHHLAQTCLVNKDFYCNVIPLLYEHTAIFAWHKEAKTRVGSDHITLVLASDKTGAEGHATLLDPCKLSGSCEVCA